MPAYMDDAWAFYNHALGELREWRITDDPILLRDAAEKTWGAVIMASNALLESRGKKVPSGTNARMSAILDIENGDRRLRALELSRMFNDVKEILHQDCFYDGKCPPELVTEWISRDALAYLEDVSRAVGARR